MTWWRDRGASRRDRGFVLINGLILVAALSAIAVQVIGQAHSSVRRATHLGHAAQVDMVADAAIVFVEQLLLDDLEMSDIDHRGEAWALRAFPMKAAGGEAQIWVNDLQSRFNLNLMVSDTPEPPMAAFRQIAARAGVGSTATDALVEHYLRWLPPPGTNIVGRGGGGNFLPGDIVDLGEIVALPGISALGAERLADVMTALPRERRINLNTAPLSVLSSFSVGASPDGLAELIASRGVRPFEDMQDVEARIAMALGNIAAAAMPDDLLTVSSAWFEVIVIARFDTSVRHMRVVLHRDPDTGEIRRVLRHPLEGA